VHILFAALEAFLPEFASALGGPASWQLRRRLFRAGIGLLLLAGALLAAASLYRYAFLETSADILSSAEILSSVVIAAFGTVLLLLATTTPAQSSPSPAVPDAEALASTSVLQVAGTFDTSSSGRSFRQVATPGLLGVLGLAKGANAEIVWLVVVDGIPLHFRFGMTNAYVSDSRNGLSTPVTFSGSFLRPRLHAMMQDEAGALRHMEIEPRGILVLRLLVRIDGQPIS
jgi:hypothetical protein